MKYGQATIRDTRVLLWHLVLLVPICLLIFMAGCSKDNPTEPDGPKTGSIYGWVTNAYTSAPITGASVSCGGVSAVTHGEFGAFALDDVPTGTHTIRVSASGYDTFTESIVVEAGRSYKRLLDIYPTLPPNTGVVFGPVWDQSGARISGAAISCAGISTTSDAYGYYYLIGVPSGNRNITATKDGYEPVSKNVTVVTGETHLVPITLRPGSAADTLTIFSTKDVYVSSALPDHNFDYQNDTRYGICLKLAPDSSYDGEYIIYVYFDLSKIPSGVTIDEATIRMRNAGGSINNSSTDAVCGAKMINKSNFPFESSTYWNESTLTWNSNLNRALVNYLSSGWLFSIDGPNGDLVASVQLDIQWYVDGVESVVENYNGWFIRSFSDTDGNKYGEYKTFYSSDWSSGTRPELTIIYH